MTTSKSPCAIASVAYATGKQVFALYRSPFSPHKFTQPQLFACLILKSFFATDYRGIVVIINKHIQIRNILHLQTIPHYTTLQKASKNLLSSKKISRTITSLLQQYTDTAINLIQDIVIFDSTGFDPQQASKYYVFRKNGNANEKTPLFYSRYPKLSIATLPNSMFVLSGFVMKGPSTDMNCFERLLQKTMQLCRPVTILADAGFDKEANHIIAHEQHIETIIPCRAFRKGRIPKAKHRLNMYEYFPGERYKIRWHIETVMSMIKRNLGDKVYSKGFWSQTREIMLKVITHNISIVFV